MSLARALTTRRRKEEDTSAVAAYIGRAASQRSPNAKPIKRSEISLPVALISTTNMLSYEAPDITGAPHVQSMGGRYFSSNASVGSSAQSVSEDDSDQTGSVHSHETDATSVDLSSPDLSQDSYHQKFFAESAPSTPALSHRSSRHSQASSRPSLDSPRIPSRAPSHSKQAHMLSHKRSVQRMNTIATPSARSSVDMFSQNVNSVAPPPANHPFGKELEQLNEAAEEFGYAVRNAEADADFQIMQSKGLVRLCANDYLDEISSIYSTVFEEDQVYQPMVWI